MKPHKIDDIIITLNKTGARQYTKVSYPIRYGHFGEIKTPAYTFQFNLKHEIKYIQGRGNGWPSPSEWLKRTVGNDWIYYLAGDYSGVHDAFGEYYLPCPSYPTNSYISRNPFKDRAVTSAIDAWQNLNEKVLTLASSAELASIKQFLQKVADNGPEALVRKAQQFHRIINGQITVLPPDTRHVDYEVIPIVIADGCLYKCGFCRVKSRDDFKPRTRENIINQIDRLKVFYGHDLKNYNAIFLGLHDALYADADLILFAAKKAYDLLVLKDRHLKGAYLFFFGSVDAINDSKMSFFDALQALPYKTYINIGLESTDPETLSILKKPITPKMVSEAFAKMLAINKKYSKIEITANFVYGDRLPQNHIRSFFDLTRKKLDHRLRKGTVYFSPLMNGEINDNRNIVRRFYRIKTQNPLPSYLYLIQRL